MSEDRTKVSVPWDWILEEKIPAETQLRIFLRAFPKVSRKKPESIAMCLGISPENYRHWYYRTLLPVLETDYLARKDLPEEQRRALENLTETKITNPTYAEEARRKRFGSADANFTFRIAGNPLWDAQLCKYRGLFDLGTYQEFWCDKLPAALHKTPWGKIPDRNLRLSAFVCWAFWKHIYGDTLKDDGIWMLLKLSKVIPDPKDLNYCVQACSRTEGGR